MKNNSRRQFLKSAGKYTAMGLGMNAALAFFLSGCKTMETFENISLSLPVGDKTISTSQFDSIKNLGTAASKALEDFTPEQEYYIGRTVGAVILGKYKPYDNPRVNAYVNHLGQTLAAYSDTPDTFGGYHFLVQDSRQINALAAPGGFIFITRGLMRCCEHEDALAGVLAHEIGHVQSRHGIQAIKKSRYTELIKIGFFEGTKQFGKGNLVRITQQFKKSISDITSTLIDNGYSREFEREADKAAADIMNRVGYNPNALVDLLDRMEEKLEPGTPDFAKTHPSPESRIADLSKIMGPYQPVTLPKSRRDRFKQIIRQV